jgi:hypothetical protein
MATDMDDRVCTFPQDYILVQVTHVIPAEDTWWLDSKRNK